MRDRYLGIGLLLIIASCGTKQTKRGAIREGVAQYSDTGSSNITKNTAYAMPDSTPGKKAIDSSELIRFQKEIKGTWTTDGEKITTIFLDNLSIDMDNGNRDSAAYTISYRSCENGEMGNGEIIYLTRTSKDGDANCFSIEGVTKHHLSLMSLGNGSMWTLHR